MDSTPQPPSNKGKGKFYQRLADQIQREDALVNTRLSWMLTTQGLLFAGLALIANEKVKPEMYSFMRFLLPCVGIIISVIAFLGVKGANIALRDLKKLWTYNDPFFPPFVNKRASYYGRIPSRSLPLIFLVIWIVILCFFPF